MIHRKLVRVFSGALLAALVYACSDNTPTSGPSAGYLTIDNLAVAIPEGTTHQLNAMLNGESVPVTWASSDVSIATVSSTGLVTAVDHSIDRVAGKPWYSSCICSFVAITATLISDPSESRSTSVTVGLPPLEPGQIISGVAVTNVSSGTRARSDGLYYHIYVPAGATKLTVTFTGGTGDGDIYVRPGQPPNADNDYPPPGGCASGAAGNAESCSITNPVAGIWYIFVAVWDPYAGATLKATIEPTPVL
jgi:Bacterial pre-peptidase C-terminal domain/Bacterial Ig-like domain (group 2)